MLSAAKGKKERVGRLMQMHANSREDVKEARAGDIVAIAGARARRLCGCRCRCPAPATAGGGGAAGAAAAVCCLGSSVCPARRRPATHPPTPPPRPARPAGLKDVVTGDTLCDEKAPVMLERMEFPDPVIKVG